MRRLIIRHVSDRCWGASKHCLTEPQKSHTAAFFQLLKM